MKHVFHIKQKEHGKMKFIIFISLMLVFYVLWLYIVYVFYTPFGINGKKARGDSNLNLTSQTSKSISVINNTRIKSEEYPYLKEDKLQEYLPLEESYDRKE